MTFEERVAASLDDLFATAVLMTGDPPRAESLVVSAVVDASRRHRSDPPSGDFRKWIIGRLVTHYLGYVDDPEDEGNRGRAGVAPARSTRDAAPDPRGRRAARESRGGTDGRARPADGLPRLGETPPEEWGDLVRSEMSNLGLGDRLIVWLVTVMEWKYSEVGSLLGLGSGELRDRLYEARRELQERVAETLRGRGPRGEDMESAHADV